MEPSGTTKDPAKYPVFTHHQSRLLVLASMIAVYVAFRNKRDELVPCDLLIGMYVASLECISDFWPRPQVLDSLVAKHCGWRESRALTWQRWNDKWQKSSRRLRFPFFITFGRKRWARSLSGLMFKQSHDWTRLFEAGERLTPHKVTWRDCTLPLLTPEIMLLALIRTEGIPLGKHLQETGLMVDRLEEAAIRRIDNPAVSYTHLTLPTICSV